MRLKVGNKIVCKCDNYYGGIKNPVYMLRKDTAYIITHIKEDYMGLWVRVNNDHPLVGFLFKKYFYTKNELRKLKLNKINGKV